MKKAILCVDDEVIILIALKMTLKRHYGSEYIIESAGSGRQALDILEELTTRGVDVRLVITDWLMPGMKGDDLLREIKREYPPVKGIMLTGQADRKSVDRVKSEGLADTVLYKPWSENSLHSALKKSLAGM